MKKWILILFLAVIGVLNLAETHSQTPGFLGKKFSLGYRIYTFGGLKGKPNYRKGNPPRFYIRTRHHLEMDYVLSRRLTGGMDFGLFRNGMSVQGPRSLFYHVQLPGWSTGAHFRFYPFLRRGNIAPIGPYTEIRLSYLRYNLINPDSSLSQTGEPNLGTGSNLAFTFAWGRNYLQKKSLLLSYGLQAGLLFPLSPDTAYTDDAYLRLWSSWGINFHFGVGGLLF